jgi:hypothetical protein
MENSKAQRSASCPSTRQKHEEMAAKARDRVARRKLGVADMFAVGRDCDT